MQFRLRFFAFLSTLLLASGCTEPVSPLSISIDFGEHYLPGSYSESQALSNETLGKLTLESASFADGSLFTLDTPLPLEMDGGAEYPLDLTFTTMEGSFGELEDTVTLTLARAQGEPFTALWTLKAIFHDGDLDNDGHVDVAFGGDDCQDDVAAIYEGAEEICDGLDNDCDGLLGDGTGGTPDENDSDGDGYLGCEDDCNDDQAGINPDADEGCDGVDTNCDGSLGTDELDLDGDTYSVCEGDCGEGDPSVSPGAPEELCDGLDTDCNGALPSDEVDLDGDTYFACEDCDDDNPDANPGKLAEACDGFDTDCDGLVDDEDPDTDTDGDGFSACDGIDCDDSAADVFPGNPELCDGIDNDCDPATDEAIDFDGDGDSACGGDCNDLSTDVYVGAPEICDGLDNDCDGNLGDGVGGTPNESDADGDGETVCGGDCDDGDSSNFPGNTEVCDGQDNNCDLLIDEGMDDLDNDGVVFCIDCDDMDQSAFPGNPEVCDGVDNDCNPSTDELVDGDGDGSTTCSGDCDDTDAAISPLASEICDGLDNDCDGDLVLGEDMDSDGDGNLDCSDADCPHWVDASFTGSNIGTQSSPWQTISQALSNLDGNSCNTAWVGPGTYAQNLNWPSSGDDISIISTDGAGATVIMSNTGGRPINIAGGQSLDTEIRGFRITGGVSGANGGAIRLANSSLTLSDSVLDDNEADDDGGAIYVLGGDLVVTGSEFDTNVAGVHGGAIFLEGGDLTVQDCQFLDNEAFVDGGSVYFDSGSIIVQRSTFQGSSAGDDGGALFLKPGGAQVTINNSTFLDNEADDNGGCLFVDNYAGQIFRNEFISCSAADFGGAAFLGSTAGVALFYNNELNNSSGDIGGALYTTAGANQVVNNTLFDSHALDPNYGAIVHLGGSAIFDNNIVAFGTGYGLRETSSCCQSISYNNVFGSSLSAYYGTSLTGQDGNLSVDPGFALGLADGNPDNDDLSLAPGSPSADAGNPGSVYNDADGSRNDQGAYGGPAGNW